jgi:3-oxoacyl-[acyl-carrier protein] reductase
MSRRVLITGTTRGLGQFLAEHYLEAGDQVVGCGRSDPSVQHERYTHHTLDVTDEAAVGKLTATIRQRFGGLDVLINNAGVASMNAIALTPPSAARRVMETNFISAVTLTHAALRLMRRSTAGRIVNISTIAVPLRLEGEAIYAASKSALEMFTRIAARELGSMGITCNAVGPSVVRTRLTDGVPQEKLDRLVRAQAIQTMATPADVANVIDFFLRPESRLITGQVVYLGGFG